VPHVSPLKGPSRSFEFTEKKMENDEMVRGIARDRLTPRLFFICDKNLCYPVDATYEFFDVGQKLGILDVCSMESDDFTNPCAADMVKNMALETESESPSVALRVSPAPGRVMKGASSSLHSDVKMKVKSSIFDVVSPMSKHPGGSKEAEMAAKEDAVSSLLAWVDDERREKLMGGYSSMPVDLRQKLLSVAVSKMGSVGAISQCARVLRKADAWLRARYSSNHGFKMKNGIVMWFLYDHAVRMEGSSEYHVSEYCRSGLVFAKLHLMMEIDVQDSVVVAFSKRISHTPVPAASASVRLVLELLIFGNDPTRNPQERYYSVAFAAKALVALRGIDAQRSSFKETCDVFFVGCAWDSKKKRAMVWACPKTFLGYDVYGVLSMFWKGDYMFPAVTGKRGCSLEESTGFADKMASAYVVLRHFREIAAAIGMPVEAAKVIRRHSWRHFAANVTRVAEFTEAKKSQVGRWGSLEVMPVRYAQEVENVAMMGIILEVEQVLKEALQRVPLKKWPWLAGWEHLSPHVSLRPEMVQEIPVACMPELEDRSDDEDSEVEEDSDVDDAESGQLAVRSESDGEAVLRAWDALQCEKVAARMTVGDWTVEFVLRKISDSSAGDCYAKCAGRPRVRSRVALVAMLGLTDSAIEKRDRSDRVERNDERGAGSSSGPVEAASVELAEPSIPHDESITETTVCETVESAVAACKEAWKHSVSEWTQAVLAADAVVQRAQRSDATTALGGELDDEVDDEVDDEADDEMDGSVFLIKPGKVRRPPGASLDLWRLTHGGFPDGDTAMSPPAEAKRTKRAQQGKRRFGTEWM
jgi:hypothetical protein